MTREELLDFLKNKRSATAGVASAQQAPAWSLLVRPLPSGCSYSSICTICHQLMRRFKKIKQAYNKSWLIQFINKRPMGSQRNSTITGMRYGFGS